MSAETATARRRSGNQLLEHPGDFAFMLRQPMRGDRDAKNLAGLRFLCPQCKAVATLHFGKPTDGCFSWDGDIETPSIGQVIREPACGWRGYLRGTWMSVLEASAI